MHRPSPSFVYACVMTLALGVGSFAACAKQSRSNGPSPSVSNVSGEVVDDVLMAYLSNARSLHHEADMQEDAGNIQGAIATLQRLLDKPSPGKSPEVDEVLADTHARIAELRAQIGEFDAGEHDVDVGLGLAPDISYFRGHLLEVRGVIEEKRSKALADKGDAAGAAKAKEAAMAAYEAAIGVQDEVIRRGTADGGTP